MVSLKKNKPNPPKKLQLNSLIFLGVVALSLTARLYKIDAPLADWHSWRQADTASVAREYVKNGIDLLRPKYLDLSDIPSGKDNQEGFRMVEFPLISAKVAWSYQFFGLQEIPLHVIYRVVSILFSIGSLYLLYRIVWEVENQTTAIIAATVFGILPYSVFYSRTILPEMPLVFFSLGSLYFLLRFFNTKNHSWMTSWYWLAVVFASIALLIKPTAIFFALPAIYAGFATCGTNLLKDKKSYLFAVLVFVPLLAWRYWIQKFPEGIPAYEWLLNGNNIRFKGAFFRWIFADRIGRLILGYWGVILLAMGFLQKGSSEKKPINPNIFFGSWLLSMLAYLTIFATGNVQHDYYQIILIPIISIYVAKGILFLWDQKSFISKLLTLVSCAFMLAFSWYEVRGYYNINNPAIVEAGRAVDRLVEPDALVIAPYGGDTAFLYQTNRRGWPIGGQIEKRIQQGADVYVTTSLDDEAKTLMEKYEVIETNDAYTIINLGALKKIPEKNLEADVISTPTPSLSPSSAPSPAPEDTRVDDNLPPGLRKKLK